MSSGRDVQRERVMPSGIVLPPRDAGHPIVTLQTAVPQLQFVAALDHEAEGGLERVAELWKRICDAQLAADVGEFTPLESFTDPQFGLPWNLTPAGLRSILAVIPGYAQYLDVAATEKLGRPVWKQRAESITGGN